MFLVFAVLIASLLGAPGLRLLRSAFVDRRESELWLGSALVLVGLGLGLRFYTTLPIAAGAGGGFLVANLAGHFLVAAGAFSLYVFIWRVFHCSSLLARAIVIAIGIAIAADLVWIAQEGGHRLERHPSIVVANALRGAVLPWVFVESLRYRRMMLRRVALGIGDPVVANRFTLWAIWSGALSALPIFVLAARLAVGQSDEGGAHGASLHAVLPIIRVIALGGVSSAVVCIWLSFFPPDAYIARLRRGGLPA